MEEPQKNKLIVIGNGFDLAHGFKTSYSDFMFDLVMQDLKLVGGELAEPQPSKRFVKTNEEFHFKMNPRTMLTSDFIERYIELKKRSESDKIDKIKELKVFIDQYQNEFSMEMNPHHLFHFLFADLTLHNWVDIEEAYYKQVKKRVKGVHLSPETKINKSGIEQINKGLHFLTEKLHDFLLKSTDFQSKNTHYVTGMEKLFVGGDAKKIIILNFNYTKTFERYFQKGTHYEIVNIHGTLADNLNPIIFGVGDENHSIYPNIVEANEDELLVNVKSLKYLETNNYINLKAELLKPFDVEIIGHSCGISDRTLLKEIYNQEECKKINIYHHKGLNSYRSSIYGISRYFDNNYAMRQKVEPYDPNLHIPQDGE